MTSQQLSSKVQLTTEQQEQFFHALLKRKDNIYCADCNAKHPKWISLDFGAIVCMNCSGAHRALGPQYTRVKSAVLDSWTSDLVFIINNLGNLISNLYFENSIPLGEVKPNFESTQEDRNRYVQRKYIQKKFALQKFDDPKTLLFKGKIYNEILSLYQQNSQSQMNKPPLNKVPKFQLQDGGQKKVNQESEFDSDNAFKKFYSDNGSGFAFGKSFKNNDQCQFNSSSAAKTVPSKDLLDFDLIDETNQPKTCNNLSIFNSCQMFPQQSQQKTSIPLQKNMINLNFNDGFANNQKNQAQTPSAQLQFNPNSLKNNPFATDSLTNSVPTQQAQNMNFPAQFPQMNQKPTTPLPNNSSDLLNFDFPAEKPVQQIAQTQQQPQQQYYQQFMTTNQYLPQQQKVQTMDHSWNNFGNFKAPSQNENKQLQTQINPNAFNTYNPSSGGGIDLNALYQNKQVNPKLANNPFVDF